MARSNEPQGMLTPESYLGWHRLRRFAGPTVFPERSYVYRFPARPLAPNELAYAGRWRVEGERIVSTAGSRLRLRFVARAVHLVLGGRGDVDVLLDGTPVRTVRVRESRLYTLLRLPRRRFGLLELRFSRGLEAYAFTFG